MSYGEGWFFVVISRNTNEMEDSFLTIIPIFQENRGQVKFNTVTRLFEIGEFLSWQVILFNSAFSFFFLPSGVLIVLLE